MNSAHVNVQQKCRYYIHMDCILYFTTSPHASTFNMASFCMYFSTIYVLLHSVQLQQNLVSVHRKNTFTFSIQIFLQVYCDIAGSFRSLSDDVTALFLDRLFWEVAVLSWKSTSVYKCNPTTYYQNFHFITWRCKKEVPKVYPTMWCVVFVTVICQHQHVCKF